MEDKGSRDLTEIGNIFKRCAELSDEPLIDFIKRQCEINGISDFADDIMKIVAKCVTLYNIGEVIYNG